MNIPGIRFPRKCAAVLALALTLSVARGQTDTGWVEVGLAARDVSPDLPIRLAGYAFRNRPAEKTDQPLLVQAIAWRCENGERVVMAALDNCEVGQAFTAPVLRELEEAHGLKPGRVMIVSSHTHSAPVLEGTLDGMQGFPEADAVQIHRYSDQLKRALVAVVGEALTNLQPARLEYGVGRATFAMNRRSFRSGQVGFGDNPDGPVDRETPVLRVTGTNGALRAILFGYACHGTSVRTGEDFYTVSGEYMAYARQHLEALHPGAMALFLTGMGADSDPAPRGDLMVARRHGLELAGAVMGTLDRGMQTVAGPVRFAYEEVSLPFAATPHRETLEKDAQDGDKYRRKRAERYLSLLEAGKPLPTHVSLPLAVLRVGNDLTFIAMGGEPVVDYALRFKRQFARERPWTVGYAYHVPCYIPTSRIILEGGYESDSSLIYYGYYGPFQGGIDELLTQRVAALLDAARAR